MRHCLQSETTHHTVEFTRIEKVFHHSQLTTKARRCGEIYQYCGLMFPRSNCWDRLLSEQFWVYFLYLVGTNPSLYSHLTISLPQLLILSIAPV